MRGIQEQLRQAMRTNAKLRSEITQCQKEREKAELEIQSLKTRLESVRRLNGQKTRKLNDYIAITQITNDVEGSQADFARKI